MVLRVDSLIYLYIALCFCMLAFNIIYTLKTKWADRAREKKVLKCMRGLAAFIEEPREMEPGRERLFRWGMRRIGSLDIFYEASVRICAQENGRQKFAAWLECNRDAFLKLESHYLGKDALYKAFYAYIVWHYRLCVGRRKEYVIRKMQETVLEPSIYCRENALCALYSSGDAAAVVKAYELLTRHGIRHSPRLVTDGLLTFAGSLDDLAEELWNEWDLFGDGYRTAFINFMRIASGNFRRRFIPLLIDEGTDREVRSAIIRYYRKYYYEDAMEPLVEMTKNWEREDWEFAALAALALENYPGRERIKALQEALHSYTWYVRENAAESLIKLDSEENIQGFLKQETDRYAADMLNYKFGRRGIE